MTHPDLQIILGPPGTGKTTTLLNIMQDELSRGVDPRRLGFVAFTKKAAQEAKERACERFAYRAEDLPYMRTIHSLAFKQIGLKPDRVMQWSHYRELADALGIELKGSSALDDGLYGMSAGDRLMFLEGLARVKQCALHSVWEDADEIDIDFRELERFSRALAAFKQARGLLDYTDMLDVFVAHAQATVPQLDVLIVDEAQDLSIKQWGVIDAIAARAARVYVAGDDLQAIFQWAGADVATFLGLQGKRKVLEQSYRIPRAVHHVAARIAARIVQKSVQVYRPREEQGAVHWYADPDEVDLSQGTWLLLARNGYMLEALEDMCRRQGFSYTSVGRNPLDSPALKAIVLYERLRKGQPVDKQDAELVMKWMTTRHASQGVRAALRKHPAKQQLTIRDLQAWGFAKEPPIWHVMLDRISDDDREFFIAARKRGETLTKTPRIRISTIHCSKGGEADNILLLTDMSTRTRQEMERNPDSELRCWYVAVTRTKQALHLVQPRTGNCFEL